MSKTGTPKMIGPYQVIRPLDPGTLGEIYLCRRVSGTAKDAVPYVVKTYRPDLVEMRKEIELLEKPVHRSMIQYRQVGYDAEAERYYVVMDRLQVEPHGAELMRKSKLTFKQKIKRFLDVGEALATLHELKDYEQRPLYHGALKPSNILVRRPQDEYHMVLTDFGFLYKYDPEEYAKSEGYFHSWLFMAPEVILWAHPELWPKHGRPPTPCPASDVYSWALVMVHSLNGGRDGFYYVTGKTQGDDKLDERVRQDLPILYQKKLDVADRWTLVVGGKAELESDRFIEFVFRCLAPDPRDRYENLTAGLEAFRECLL